MWEDYNAAVGHFTLAIGSARAELFENPSKGRLKIMLASYYTSRAAALTKLKQYDEALKDCIRALEFDWGSVKAYQRQGRIFIMVGKLKEAIETYERASKVDHEAVAEDRKLAESMKRKYDNAKEVIEKQRVSKYADNERAVETAKSDLKIILTHCPEWDEARILEIEAMFYHGDVDEAYQVTSALVKDGFGRNPDLLELRARLMLSKGRLLDARKQLEVILKGYHEHAGKVKPLYDNVLFITQLMDQGEESYSKKDFQRAARFYSSAIDACPDFAEGMATKVRFSRGTVYGCLEEHGLAIEDYAAIIRHDPRHVKAYFRQGISYMAVKNGDKIRNLNSAVSSFQNAIEVCQSSAFEEEIHQKLEEASKELLDHKFLSKDYFSILGLPRNATLSEVYSAYKMRSLRIHNAKHTAPSPKIKAELDREFSDVTEAYEVISEAFKRYAVDRFPLEKTTNDSQSFGGMHKDNVSNRTRNSDSNAMLLEKYNRVPIPMQYELPSNVMPQYHANAQDVTNYCCSNLTRNDAIIMKPIIQQNAENHATRPSIISPYGANTAVEWIPTIETVGNSRGGLLPYTNYSLGAALPSSIPIPRKMPQGVLTAVRKHSKTQLNPVQAIHRQSQPQLIPHRAMQRQTQSQLSPVRAMQRSTPSQLSPVRAVQKPSQLSPIRALQKTSQPIPVRSMPPAQRRDNTPTNLNQSNSGIGGNPTSNLPTEFRHSLSMNESGPTSKGAVNGQQAVIHGRGGLSKHMSAKF
jgi:tetratricopeptide (TPR) repeat protein